MAPIASALSESAAARRETVPAGEAWTGLLRTGERLRIVDLHGKQVVSTLFYRADKPDERYSAQDTIRAQGNIYLSSGTALLSNEGNTMLTIVADTCGRHDTLAGACSAESNAVCYALEVRHMHSCRDNFLLALAQGGVQCGRELGKRDLVGSINFFANVPVTPAGLLMLAEGVSAAGRYVEMRAQMDVTVLLSNCPQLNNPCNAYDPTPIAVLAWAADV